MTRFQVLRLDDAAAPYLAFAKREAQREIDNRQGTGTDSFTRRWIVGQATIHARGVRAGPDWLVKLSLEAGASQIYYIGGVPAVDCTCRTLRILPTRPTFAVVEGTKTSIIIRPGNDPAGGHYINRWETTVYVNGVAVEVFQSQVEHINTRVGASPGTITVTFTDTYTNVLTPASYDYVLSANGYDPNSDASQYLMSGVFRSVIVTVPFISVTVTNSHNVTVRPLSPEAYLAAAGSTRRTRVLLSDGVELASAEFEEDEFGNRLNYAITPWSGGGYVDLYNDPDFGEPREPTFPGTSFEPFPEFSQRLTFQVPSDVCQPPGPDDYPFGPQWLLQGGTWRQDPLDLSNWEKHNTTVFLVGPPGFEPEERYTNVTAALSLPDGNHSSGSKVDVGYYWLKVFGEDVGTPPDVDSAPRLMAYSGGIPPFNTTPGIFEARMTLSFPNGQLERYHGTVEFSVDSSLGTWKYTNFPIPYGHQLTWLDSPSRFNLLNGTITTDGRGNTSIAVVATPLIGDQAPDQFRIDWDAARLVAKQRELERLKGCHTSTIQSMRRGQVSDALTAGLMSYHPESDGYTYVDEPLKYSTIRSPQTETILEQVTEGSVTFNTVVRISRTKSAVMSYMDIVNGSPVEVVKEISGSETVVKTLYKSPTTAYSNSRFFTTTTYADWMVADTSGNQRTFDDFEDPIPATIFLLGSELHLRNGIAVTGAANVFGQFDERGNQWTPPVPLTSAAASAFDDFYRQYRARYPVKWDPNGIPTGKTKVKARILDGETIDVIPLSIIHAELGNLGAFARSSDFVSAAERLGSLLTFAVDWMFTYRFVAATGTFEYLGAKRAPLLDDEGKAVLDSQGKHRFVDNREQPVVRRIEFRSAVRDNAIHRANGIVLPDLVAKAKEQRERMKESFERESVAADGMPSALSNAIAAFVGEQVAQEEVIIAVAKAIATFVPYAEDAPL
jgi:hypothetical protein